MNAYTAFLTEKSTTKQFHIRTLASCNLSYNCRGIRSHLQKRHDYATQKNSRQNCSRSDICNGISRVLSWNQCADMVGCILLSLLPMRSLRILEPRNQHRVRGRIIQPQRQQRIQPRILQSRSGIRGSHIL